MNSNDEKIIVFKNDAVGDLTQSLKAIKNITSTHKDKIIEIYLSERSEKFYFLINDENVKFKKLRNLNSYNTKRRKIAAFYNKNIRNVKITKLNYSKSCVYHQYVILVNDRRNLIKLFNKKRIQYGFHYPYAIHQLSVFKKKFKNKSFKNAEILAKNSISLPIDPNLSKNELTYIVKTLNEF